MTALKILVTGAGGFVGEALVFRLLAEREFSPVAALRGASRLCGLCPVVHFDLTNLKTLPPLDDVQVVIHTAARVHIMDEKSADALAEFRKVNVEGTLRLAKHAVKAGVKRFIFISTIKVNGETTGLGRPFTADDDPKPLDPYSISKYEAELALTQLAKNSGMELVILRPPLVYGPRVKGNFLRLLNALRVGVPLPLGAIHNQRSLVSVENLVSLIIHCIDHPAAANQTFLVSDGEDLSTTQLARRLSKALGNRAILLPVPEWCLNLLASILGKKAAVQRICESLQVDIGKNSELLSWAPPVSTDKALRRTASFYQQELTK
ncbi:UDP-glucose 4-epimerase family protein [Pseudomonas sp. TNT2022 ID642]|uniref:UDP-glucose 4-epimerase family protein n=1 Tax=Pseudomonas sp. TNT2022 ID642 TaxID=2942632 RepID=UPI0023609C40|nr:SDR family oxidoreductase [Pseudomonas sp. TNT2022 ID642]MDD1005308.1 SDR family oxidoreductase [Pseudomonas sp. TNT2022 ID642]